jgi:hypothetical protein
MQSKLFLCSLLLTPLFAQEAPAAVNPSETQKTDQTANQSEVQQNVGFNITTINVEFRLIKENDSIDKTVWHDLKKSVRECGQLIKNKQYEQAGALLDSIENTKPAGVAALFVVGASTDSTLVHAQINYSTAVARAAFGQCKCTVCEINKTAVTKEAWQAALDLALSAMRSNQELSYDQAKQLAFLIISKAN